MSPTPVGPWMTMIVPCSKIKISITSRQQHKGVTVAASLLACAAQLPPRSIRGGTLEQFLIPSRSGPCPRWKQTPVAVPGPTIRLQNTVGAAKPPPPQETARNRKKQREQAP